MPRVALSVLIAVRDEARNLPHVLASVVDWAEQVVVIDSGSRDDSTAIARAAGAETVVFRYRGGWPKKRQWALDNCKWRNEWILILDADESLEEQNRLEIGKAIRSTGIDGYWIPFSITFLGRRLRYGDSKLWKCVLFRYGKGRYERRFNHHDESMGDVEVHEHVIVDGTIARLRHPVRHENRNDLYRYIEKHNEYSTWEAQLLFEGQTNGSLPARLFGNQAERRRWLKSRFIRSPGAPVLRFVYLYVLRFGWLDGLPGFVHAVFKGVQTFHVRAKVRELRMRNLLSDDS